MRIGVMLRHLGTERGGIGRYTQSLVDKLLAIDTTNQYVMLYKDGDLLGSYSGFPNAEERVLSGSSHLIWDQEAVPRFAWAQKFDLLFNPKLSVPLFAPCKTVLVLHGADWFAVPEMYSFHYQVYHKVAATLYSRKADAIVVASQDAADKIQQFVKAARGKTVAIHHGVSEEFRPIDDRGYLDDVRQRYGLPERFILYLGKIYPMKNVARIIRAYARLRNEIPHKLVIAGSPSWKSEGELAPIHELGLDKDVLVTGWVPDGALPAFYNLADLFVFPSLYEGFGIPLLEAMACGCPVVTSTAGACPEVVGGAAVLVDPTDVEAIARATRNLLTEPTRAQDLVAKGLRRARMFSWEASARRTLELFERVAGEASGHPA
jgi:glycosyltransferase involved in cell wall biosynthesis